MSRVVRSLLERLTALDLNLAARFARRGVQKASAYGAMARHRFGPPSSLSSASRDALPSAGSCLGGLDVEWSGSGSTLTVQPGALVMRNVAAATETRPGSWTGRVEADDFSYAIGELAVATSAAPASPIGAATADVEWWLVYASLSEATIETDTTAKTFDEGTGLFVTASAAKVKQHALGITVLRGTAGGAIPTLPANCVPLAWVCVPLGATDLSQAVIFDVRKIAGERTGPNEISGQWECPIDGQLSAPYTSGSSKEVWRGDVRAWLGGELLEARVRKGFYITGIAEPGATWDATATALAPKTAYLYLCKVRGVVPRPVRRGSYGISNHPSVTTDIAFLSGALVLSPTPPKLGCSYSDTHTAQRWDLRASATLSLPQNLPPGSLEYRYTGETAPADDCICIGVLRYTGVDGGAGVPLIQGQLFCDQDGWITGEAFANMPTTDLMGVSSSALTTLTSKIDVSQQTITVSGTAWCLPFGGVRVAATCHTTNANHNMSVYYGPNSGTRMPTVTSPEDSSKYGTVFPLEFRFPAPGYQGGNITIAKVVSTDVGGTMAVARALLTGLRFPYREPLVT